MIDFPSILPNDKEIHIVIHNFPDPDAISSAIGVLHYIKHIGKKPGHIYYSGEISHPQNKSLITLLNIELINYEQEPFPRGSDVIIVDTNNIGEGSNQSNIPHNEAHILAIIDHHKGKHPNDSQVDCRFVGASASIVWDYLTKVNYPFDSDEGKILATALIVGISTDTNSLMSDNIEDLDFVAYQDLIKKVDKQKLKSIMLFPLPSYLFELRQKAFLPENQLLVESTIASGVGIIKPSKRDAIPIIADELLRMNGITTSIVFAIIDDYIDISVRSNDITLDMGTFIQSVFQHGGGKQGSGRARIPLGFFAMNGDEELNNNIWEVSKKLIFSKTLSNVKGN